MKEELRLKIEKNIKQFDLSALLHLLKANGVRSEHIYFLSSNSLSSPPNLCESITFSNDAPKVTIMLNMGLLGSNSSLPSFLQELMDREEIQTECFIRFLNFFNHHLMDTLLQLSMPELNDNFFLDWKYTQLQYLKLLGFESVGTLWFLMKICFPDLVIEVKKNPQKVQLATSSLILGRDGLGYTSYLGNRFSQTLSSFKIILTTDNEVSEIGTPWPMEINKRLIDLIFPILKKTDLHLSIVLNIKNKRNYLTLGPKSFLGFDRMSTSTSPFQLLIFYGLIKNLKRNAYLS